jgi:type I restriction enzyme S subunit
VAFCRIKETRETISEKGFKNSSVRLCPIGTVLLAMIGEGKTRGQAAILDIPACHNQNSASIRVSDTPIPPEYIYHFLRFRYEITRATGQGGNQPALSGEIVKSIQIPLPPLVEIAAICEAIEMQFNVLANCESSLNGLENLIEAQKKVILREAFSGRLVSQDSTDEPASLLIERIAAERAPCEQSSTKGKSNRRWPSGMTAREIATRKPASRKGEAKA